MSSRSEPVQQPSDAFLRELADADAHALGLECLADALPARARAASLRARVLASAAQQPRLARFAAQVAELLDVGLERAHALLARLDHASAWTPELPGISFLWVDGGPRVADALRGFVRVHAGQEFPEHAHLGDEVTLVLQGGFEDPTRGRVFRPGDLDRMAAGTSHHFRAADGGVDLLKLSVVHAGIRALGHSYLPR
jgi:putative transcriptional regulator